ncbi:hypothetical protein BDA99DRAFT_544395 [Phascolomyces articulosus]|uniref:Uncharacterized protein n=1 Tax=Phascolomyces articulosus TaxID=60185 RepID=A0AAD5P783_9FUNG|nr:hypothetical protein BDA99DRAFT_544395 [Phascolomyces articulosus]
MKQLYAISTTCAFCYFKNIMDLVNDFIVADNTDHYDRKKIRVGLLAHIRFLTILGNWRFLMMMKRNKKPEFMFSELNREHGESESIIIHDALSQYRKYMLLAVEELISGEMMGLCSIIDFYEGICSATYIQWIATKFLYTTLMVYRLAFYPYVKQIKKREEQ